MIGTKHLVSICIRMYNAVQKKLLNKYTFEFTWNGGREKSTFRRTMACRQNVHPVDILSSTLCRLRSNSQGSWRITIKFASRLLYETNILRCAGFFGRGPVREVFDRPAAVRVPGRPRLRRRAAPPPPTSSRSAACHFVRHHIDDARQSPTPAGANVRQVCDTVQSES